MVSQKKSLCHDLYVGFSGFAMGVANVIPGVSGGTMAFILGVFEPLVDAISIIASKETLTLLLHGQIKALYERIPWRFLIALGIGILVAFAGVSKLFVWLLEKHPAMTYAFFFGLILASVVSVWKMVGRWKCTASVTGLIAGTAIAYLVISLVPVDTPDNWLVTFLCGIIAVCAMILPGLSGSFLLLILGQYNYVWGAIGDFTTGHFSWGGAATIFWLGLGCVVGLGGFVHLLKYLFAKWHDATIAVLIGFMLGSLPRLWPWQTVTGFAVKTGSSITRVTAANDLMYQAAQQAGGKVTVLTVKNVLPADFGWTFWGPVLLLVIGFAIVFALDRLAARRETK